MAHFGEWYFDRRPNPQLLPIVCPFITRLKLIEIIIRSVSHSRITVSLEIISCCCFGMPFVNFSNRKSPTNWVKCFTKNDMPIAKHTLTVVPRNSLIATIANLFSFRRFAFFDKSIIPHFFYFFGFFFSRFLSSFVATALRQRENPTL